MKLLYNARVYSLDREDATTSAILIQGERIRALGESSQMLLECKGTAETFDLHGAPVIPGLTDAHIHLEHYALSLQKVDCETASLTECLRRVSERIHITPPGEWILGHGWNQNNWPEGFGTAQQLDSIAPHHPVYLTAKSLHAAWANSTALKLAGITSITPDPQDGRIGGDAQGKPNGILFEAAMQLVADVIPIPAASQLAEAIRAAQPALWQMGLTGVHDFDRQRCFTALQMLHARDELKMRVLKSLPLEDLPHAIALGLRSGFGDDWLRIGGIKAFADGALGPRTAAMLQPYENEPDNRGMLMLDAEQLFEHGRLAVENGFSLAVHAIGDRAVHEVLNAFEQLRVYERQVTGDNLHQTGDKSRRSGVSSHLPHRIEHVQLIHPDDSSRLAQLDMVASMQPIHATSDMRMADQYWGKRADLAYAWKTQLDSGAVLAFGSDAPVESPNPWWGLHAAVTRCRADGSPGPDGWRPDQKVSVLAGLHGFTRGAAVAAGMADRLGRVAPGYLADLVVLDTDPFTCDPHALKDVRPLATMIGGEWVWRGGL